MVSLGRCQTANLAAPWPALVAWLPLGSGDDAMRLEQIRARERRLNALWFRLGAELAVWRGDLFPLEWKERQEYVRAISEVRQAVDQARRVLARVLLRLEK